jgi:hypothetical protein
MAFSILIDLFFPNVVLTFDLFPKAQPKLRIAKAIHKELSSMAFEEGFKKVFTRAFSLA